MGLFVKRMALHRGGKCVVVHKAVSLRWTNRRDWDLHTYFTNGYQMQEDAGLPSEKCKFHDSSKHSSF